MPILAVASASIVVVALVSAQDEAHYSLVAIPLLVAAACDRSMSHRIMSIFAFTLIAFAARPDLVMLGQVMVLVLATSVVVRRPPASAPTATGSEPA